MDRASGGGEAIVVGRAMVEAALRYAAMGWPVFPCAPRSKVPLFANPHPRHGVQRYRCRGYRDCGRLGGGKRTDSLAQQPAVTRQHAPD